MDLSKIKNKIHYWYVDSKANSTVEHNSHALKSLDGWDKATLQNSPTIKSYHLKKEKPTLINCPLMIIIL